MPFRPTPLARTQKSSSTAWLARQARDPYVKLRSSSVTADASALAATSYRSRSAFKLIEMDEKYKFLRNQRDVQVVLDLGAAPGGWSQVVAQKLGWDAPLPLLRKAERMREPRGVYPKPGHSWSGAGASSSWPLPDGDEPADEPFTNPLDISALDAGTGRGTIVAVDLLRMVPIPGVQFIQADFLAPETEALIRGIIERKRGPHGKADVILCDMAANSTGNAFHDIESSLAICTSVLEFSKRHLRSAESMQRGLGGVLLMKYFVHPLTHMFRMEHLVTNFNDVRFIKPDASRTESKEAYYLCRGFKG
ncbi:ribosomal RNA methyltransferase FtsJ domain-containing protein [Mycena rosella]|uniref:rRNA methyltransferase 2, mitochondrial n=1 Tax=Mycena rosella TaxID=1033263 RepID=A0AAD7D0V7_MYCRO|nr:ribosomal RNA methyltransferase FtsJ domain-containing protein [Mycena rosella]